MIYYKNAVMITITKEMSRKMTTIPIFLNDKFTPASLVFVSAQGGSGKTVTTLL